ALSADDKTLAVAGGSHARESKVEHPVVLINLEDNKFKSLGGAAGMYECVAFAPDGKRLAGYARTKAKGEHLVHVWELGDRGQPRGLRGHDSTVLALGFSRDGLLATASADKTVRIWNLDNKKGNNVQATLSHDGGVGHVVWSPDGKHLATTS